MSRPNARAGANANRRLGSPTPATPGIVRTTNVSTSLCKGLAGFVPLAKPAVQSAVESCQRSPSALAAVDTFITRRRSRCRTGTKW